MLCECNQVVGDHGKKIYCYHTCGELPPNNKIVHAKLFHLSSIEPVQFASRVRYGVSSQIEMIRRATQWSRDMNKGIVYLPHGMGGKLCVLKIRNAFAAARPDEAGRCGGGASKGLEDNERVISVDSFVKGDFARFAHSTISSGAAAGVFRVSVALLCRRMLIAMILAPVCTRPVLHARVCKRPQKSHTDWEAAHSDMIHVCFVVDTRVPCSQCANMKLLEHHAPPWCQFSFSTLI